MDDRCCDDRGGGGAILLAPTKQPHSINASSNRTILRRQYLLRIENSRP